MKNFFYPTFLIALIFTLSGCNNSAKNVNEVAKESSAVSMYSEIANQLLYTESANPFSISLSPVETSFHLPALHSFASATYNDKWIIIGGMEAGFHGTSNNPAPFNKSVANDSLWVIDMENGKSYGVPVPEQYLSSLTVTNPQFFQVGNNLYLCGGYSVSDASQPRFNMTSNLFFRIDIPNFIQYVQSGGASPALNAVFPVAIENEFVRVTGGELIVENDYFYLVGGQDFDGVYSVGTSGKYTNAIRSFTLQHTGEKWMLANMNSLVDSVNLRRRDINLVPFVSSDGSLEAIILGGVFTSMDLSYNKPVYIKGLSTGNPSIVIGNYEQTCNQYTCAIAPILIAPGEGMMYGLLGGISYMQYSAATGGLVVGDNGIPMPFSKLVDLIITDGDSLAEFVQLPPEPLMPAYLGSNAAFMPSPEFVSDEFENILDLAKISSDTTSMVKIGYLYGGILSEGPTSGTTLNGHVNTYANPKLYSVHLSFK